MNAKRMMREVLDGPWGRLFRNWERVAPDANGYPQVGAAWVNTGGMLARWNVAFQLAEGRVRTVPVDLHNLVPPGVITAATLVDTIGAGLLHAFGGRHVPVLGQHVVGVG